MAEDKAIQVRGKLLPVEQWQAEVLPDGRVLVSVTAHNQYRQFYTVPTVRSHADA